MFVNIIDTLLTYHRYFMTLRTKRGIETTFYQELTNSSTASRCCRLASGTQPFASNRLKVFLRRSARKPILLVLTEGMYATGTYFYKLRLPTFYLILVFFYAAFNFNLTIFLCSIKIDFTNNTILHCEVVLA